MFTTFHVLYLFVHFSLCRRQNLAKICSLFHLVLIKKRSFLTSFVFWSSFSCQMYFVWSLCFHFIHEQLTCFAFNFVQYRIPVFCVFCFCILFCSFFKTTKQKIQFEQSSLSCVCGRGIWMDGGEGCILCVWINCEIPYFLAASIDFTCQIVCYYIAYVTSGWWQESFHIEFPLGTYRQTETFEIFPEIWRALAKAQTINVSALANDLKRNYWSVQKICCTWWEYHQYVCCSEFGNRSRF